jgi:hypothetical protein
VRRWLVVALALLAAGAALFLLLSSPEPEMTPDHTPIDSESRAKLREILQEETGE